MTNKWQVTTTWPFQLLRQRPARWNSENHRKQQGRKAQLKCQAFNTGKLSAQNILVLKKPSRINKWPSFSSIIFLDTVKVYSVKPSMICFLHHPSAVDTLFCAPSYLFHTSKIAPRTENHHHLFIWLFFPTAKSCVFSEQGERLIHLHILSSGLIHRICFMNAFLNDENRGLSSIYL